MRPIEAGFTLLRIGCGTPLRCGSSVNLHRSPVRLFVCFRSELSPKFGAEIGPETVNRDAQDSCCEPHRYAVWTQPHLATNRCSCGTSRCLWHVYWNPGYGGPCRILILTQYKFDHLLVIYSGKPPPTAAQGGWHAFLYGIFGWVWTISADTSILKYFFSHELTSNHIGFGDFYFFVHINVQLILGFSFFIYAPILFIIYVHLWFMHIKVTLNALFMFLG